MLRVAGPIAGALEHLAAQAWRSSWVPWSAAVPGTGASVYFRDPDGSLLELISYSG